MLEDVQLVAIHFIESAKLRLFLAEPLDIAAFDTKFVGFKLLERTLELEYQSVSKFFESL